MYVCINGAVNGTCTVTAHCKLAIENSMTSADILPDASRLPDKVF
jgi:hypothetical protein